MSRQVLRWSLRRYDRRICAIAIMPSPLCRHHRARFSTKNKPFVLNVEVGGVQAYLSNYICLLKGVLYLSDLGTHELAKYLLGGYVLRNCRR